MLEKELREKYTWTAFYSDGTTLEQYNGEYKNDYKTIDRTKLAAFGINFEGRLIYRVFLEPEQKLIYRRRPAGNEGEHGELVVQKELILVGTQQNVNGKNVQNIAYIDVESGLVQVAGKWIGGEPTLIRGIENGE